MMARDAAQRAAPDQRRQPADQGRARAPRAPGARATGLTLVDGARELRRAMDGGADVVEAFVCEPLLAGPDARAVLDASAAAAPVHAVTEPLFAQAGLRRTPRGGRRRRPDPDARRWPASCCRPIRWWSSSRASRSPATSGRCCARGWRRCRRGRRRRRHGPTCSTRTPSARAPARSSACPWRPPRRPRSLAWLARTRPADRRGARRRRAGSTPTAT